jgi:hypothetical protein
MRYLLDSWHSRRSTGQMTLPRRSLKSTCLMVVGEVAYDSSSSRRNPASIPLFIRGALMAHGWGYSFSTGAGGDASSVVRLLLAI